MEISITSSVFSGCLLGANATVKCRLDDCKQWAPKAWKNSQLFCGLIKPFSEQWEKCGKHSGCLQSIVAQPWAAFCSMLTCWRIHKSRSSQAGRWPIISTRHSSSLHRDLIRIVKVLPLHSTERHKMKFLCWEFTKRLRVYHPTFSWILEGRNHDCHLQMDIPMKCVPYSVVRTCVCFHICSLSMGVLSSRHFLFSLLEREKQNSNRKYEYRPYTHAYE